MAKPIKYKVFLKTKVALFRFFLSLCLMYTALNSFAQNSDEPKEISRTFYLQNVNIVQKPGVLLEKQNIVIKNGLIEDLGMKIPIPHDAQIIQADSFFVYAGFIDAFSHVGIPKSDNKERPKIVDPGNPPNDIAGITPQFSATDFIKSDDKTISEMRSVGFTTTHVSPRGLMLPGQTAIYNLGEGEIDALLLKRDFAQTAQFQYNRGVYPSTVIGVISKFRELYKNAEISSKHQEKFNQNTIGLQRPTQSKELNALSPLTKNESSLFFVTPNIKDIHRAISLKEELGFNLLLTNVKQGWDVIDKIKKNKVSIILSLELPEEDKKPSTDKKSSGGGEKKDSSEIKELKVEKKVLKPKTPEEIAFEEKRQASLKEYFSQAAAFEKAGVSFAFSALSVKPSDIQKNIRLMIENGLSEKAALDGLTTFPASLLGLSSFSGTVEKGKMANLIICENSYFDKKSSIKFVFVDGKKFDYSSKPKPSKKEGNYNAFLGTWDYSLELMGQAQNGNIVISIEDNDLKIVTTSEMNPSEEQVASDIIIDGNKLTFSISPNMGGTKIEISFDLTVEEKVLSGNISIGQFGSFPFKATLVSKPE